MPPDQPPGAPPALDATLALASRLNDECRYEAADALALAAIERHPAAPPAFVRYVELADDRDDLAGMVERAQQMRARFPQHPFGYLAAAQALRQLRRLRQAEAVVADGLARFPHVGAFLVEAAHLAEARGDWSAAAARMAGFRALREDAWGWYQSVRSLMRGSRMDRADAMLEQALELFDEDEDLLELHGAVAEGLALWLEADRRWQRAMQIHPGNAEIALGHALIWSNPPHAMRDRRDWPEVFARLESLHQTHPELARGYATHVRLLREHGRLEDAASLAQRARERLPLDTGIAVQFSRVLQAQERMDAAIGLLHEAVAAIPHDAHLQADLAEALADAGRLDEAEAVCTAAIARFRYHPRPLIQYAEIAMLREDPETALARWGDGALRFPQQDAFQWGLTRARMALIGRGRELAPDADDPAAAEGGDSVRQLMLGFESLGGPGAACEFAIVQKRSGADPLGLLRWSDLSIGMLREALATRFEGVGTPAQTELVLVEDNRMYNLVDRRFAIQTHTFVREHAMPRDRLFEESCRRLVYLRGKLLRDLAAARKVLVFRLGDEPYDPADVDALFAALQGFGRVTLLCVARADEHHPKGTVERLRPGLLMGYVPALQALGLTETATWQEVCRQASLLAELPAPASVPIPVPAAAPPLALVSA